MSKATVFTETYFPPPGSAPIPNVGAWFPMRLLMKRVGSCKASGCSQPTAYVLAGTPVESVTPLYAVCDDHVCKFAEVVNGHTICPKCHYAWACG